MERAEEDFEKSDLELFMRDRGSKIDLLNIQWIYRAKSITI